MNDQTIKKKIDTTVLIYVIVMAIAFTIGLHI